MGTQIRRALAHKRIAIALLTKLETIAECGVDGSEGSRAFQSREKGSGRLSALKNCNWRMACSIDWQLEHTQLCPMATQSHSAALLGCC